MAGIDRNTGRVLDGFPHVAQSMRVIIITALGSRVMRRTFGSAVPAVLGRSLTAARLLRWKTAVIASIDLWEPRFTPTIAFSATENLPEDLILGNLALTMDGIYRPRGHLGDPTPEEQPRTFTL